MTNSTQGNACARCVCGGTCCTQSHASCCGMLSSGPAQVVMHGLPIRPAFAETRAPQRVLRKRLGMDRHLPAVLLVGAH